MVKRSVTAAKRGIIDAEMRSKSNVVALQMISPKHIRCNKCAIPAASWAVQCNNTTKLLMTYYSVIHFISNCIILNSRKVMLAADLAKMECSFHFTEHCRTCR